MIMHNSTKVDNRPLLDLKLCLHATMDFGHAGEAQVSYEVLSIEAYNRKLRFSSFHIIWNLIVIAFTFTNFEDWLITFERYF